MALAARPPLTSIDMNLRALGREAGERLLEMIGGVAIGGVVRRPCSLVVRQSSVGEGSEHEWVHACSGRGAASTISLTSRCASRIE